ncbi:hypothetical protein FZZ93_02540 [Halomonas eurihalina]|uniref:Uncharacterized protein n=1 Tax=Halomonas eurihalina TaxID=42566 RepID=A0A5D9DCC7_HALER|nr:hypothetical protein [Halomonas eurihalina]MDR5857928.1 hypothetical protein [Halomonas eurihalina]TZG41558.1 hypothetical protein FZZ93_02540 [Halomonas eurihalina]
MTATRIRIRRHGDGYAASGGGKRATCSWSREEAARRVAFKLYGETFELRYDAEAVDALPDGVLCQFIVEPHE